MVDRSWQLKSGEWLISTLTLKYIDQPWFHCHFAACPSWATIQPTVEAWTQATLERNAPDPLHMARTWQAVKALGLTLVPFDGTPTIDDFLIHVDGAEARFRY